MTPSELEGKTPRNQEAEKTSQSRLWDRWKRRLLARLQPRGRNSISIPISKFPLKEKKKESTDSALSVCNRKMEERIAKSPSELEGKMPTRHPNLTFGKIAG